MFCPSKPESWIGSVKHRSDGSPARPGEQTANVRRRSPRSEPLDLLYRCRTWQTTPFVLSRPPLHIRLSLPPSNNLSKPSIRLNFNGQIYCIKPYLPAMQSGTLYNGITYFALGPRPRLRSRRGLLLPVALPRGRLGRENQASPHVVMVIAKDVPPVWPSVALS